MSFNVYEITLKSLEKINLPYYSGFAFRGLFGNALIKTVCVFKTFKKDCNTCILKDKCIYSLIFESPAINKNNGALKGTSNIPHPFIITPEKFNLQFNRKGSIGSIYLTLFGNAVEYLPFLIFAFERMGEIGLGRNRGKFIIKEVKQFVGINRKVLIFKNGNSQITQKNFSFNFDYFKKMKTAKNSLIIKTFTPVRLKKENKFIRDNITLFDIMLAIKRRVKALSYYYSNNEIILPEVETLIENIDFKLQNLSWLDLSRYSSRQDTFMKMGGLMFESEISGEVEKIYSYLKLAEFIHIGKNVSFGLGKIKILP